MKRYPFKKNKIYVSGHRGLSCFGFENTLTAVKMAIDAGVDMIETDVRMTKDRHLILMHDRDVSRTTDGCGLVSEMTFEEIQKLNAHINSTIDISPEPPSLLSDLLELAVSYPSLLLNIELKDYPNELGTEFALESADRICDMIISYGLEDRTWINSFSGKLLEYVYKKYGSAFYYHGFYPWFILGEMDINPETFIDVACMQHRYIDDSGEIHKYKDNLCPKEWFDYLLSKGIMPLVAPSLKEYPLYDKAFSWGSRIVNIDDPVNMIKHINNDTEFEF